MAIPDAAACSRATPMTSGEASMPVTVAPSRASGSASRPAPQPTSSAVFPSRGVRLHSSHCQCWSIRSRIYLSRTGLSLCSIAEAPSGSHQSSASLPNRSTSSATMLVSAMRLPCLLRLQSGRELCVGVLMDDFQLRDGEIYCEDVPLAEIAADVGTPVYVYSTGTMCRSLAALRTGLEPLTDPL